MTFAADYLMPSQTIHIGSAAYLSIRNGQLIIKVDGVEHQRSPEDLDFVVLDHAQIIITQSVMTNLLAHRVHVIYCNERHMPFAWCQPYESHHLPNKRMRLQLNRSNTLKAALWKHTINRKIENQADVLRLIGQNAKPLDRWATEVQAADATNVEAKASKYYWRYLFTQSLFSFKRRREGNQPNNALNYGYALLRAAMARAIVGVGLLPQLGIHHRNQYNAFCLADDLMEPYRPYVDMLVLDCLEEFGEIPESLSKEHRGFLLQLLQMKGELNGKIYELPKLLAKTAESLVKAFEEQRKKLSYGRISAAEIVS